MTYPDSLMVRAKIITQKAAGGLLANAQSERDVRFSDFLQFSDSTTSEVAHSQGLKDEGGPSASDKDRIEDKAADQSSTHDREVRGPLPLVTTHQSTPTPADGWRQSIIIRNEEVDPQWSPYKLAKTG
jgi:hypothetical protein